MFAKENGLKTPRSILGPMAWISPSLGKMIGPPSSVTIARSTVVHLPCITPWSVGNGAKTEPTRRIQNLCCPIQGPERPLHRPSVSLLWKYRSSRRKPRLKRVVLRSVTMSATVIVIVIVPQNEVSGPVA